MCPRYMLRFCSPGAYFSLRNLRNLRIILLTDNGNDCQVSPNRAQFGQRGEPER